MARDVKPATMENYDRAFSTTAFSRSKPSVVGHTEEEDRAFEQSRGTCEGPNTDGTVHSTPEGPSYNKSIAS
jgi:hypothetical protein